MCTFLSLAHSPPSSPNSILSPSGQSSYIYIFIPTSLHSFSFSFSLDLCLLIEVGKRRNLRRRVEAVELLRFTLLSFHNQYHWTRLSFFLHPPVSALALFSFFFIFFSSPAISLYYFFSFLLYLQTLALADEGRGEREKETSINDDNTPNSYQGLSFVRRQHQQDWVRRERRRIRRERETEEGEGKEGSDAEKKRRENTLKFLSLVFLMHTTNLLAVTQQRL